MENMVDFKTVTLSYREKGTKSLKRLVDKMTEYQMGRCDKTEYEDALKSTLCPNCNETDLREKVLCDRCDSVEKSRTNFIKEFATWEAFVDELNLLVDPSPTVTKYYLSPPYNQNFDFTIKRDGNGTHKDWVEIKTRTIYSSGYSYRSSAKKVLVINSSMHGFDAPRLRQGFGASNIVKKMHTKCEGILTDIANSRAQEAKTKDEQTIRIEKVLKAFPEVAVRVEGTYSWDVITGWADSAGNRKFMLDGVEINTWDGEDYQVNGANGRFTAENARKVAVFLNEQKAALEALTSEVANA